MELTQRSRGPHWPIRAALADCKSTLWKETGAQVQKVEKAGPASCRQLEDGGGRREEKEEGRRREEGGGRGGCRESSQGNGGLWLEGLH